MGAQLCHVQAAQVAHLHAAQVAQPPPRPLWISSVISTHINNTMKSSDQAMYARNQNSIGTVLWPALHTHAREASLVIQVAAGCKGWRCCVYAFCNGAVLP